MLQTSSNSKIYGVACAIPNPFEMNGFVPTSIPKKLKSDFMGEFNFQFFQK